MSLLVNREGVEGEAGRYFEVDKKQSAICAWAIKYMIVSLNASEYFNGVEVVGKIGSKTVILKNIAQYSHLYTYRHELGMRIYRGNNEKHKRDRENPYGKGKVGSPMDLDEREAQILLNRAIVFKGRLYGRKNGINYAFQNEQDVYYHGYIVEAVGDDVQAALNEYNWK